MKIKWLVDCEIEVCDTWEGDELNTTPTLFKKGSELVVSVIDYAMRLLNDKLVADKTRPQLKLPDGSCTLGVCAEWFEVLEE